jgi:hypothetical protein
MTELPLDVWLNITKYFSWKDRTRLSLASTYFRHLYREEALWKNVEILHPESTNNGEDILRSNASCLKYIRSFTMRRAKRSGKLLEILFGDFTSQLRVLDLSNSQGIYRQRLNSFLQQQTQLEVLNLGNSEYSFVNNDPFAHLPNLTSLNLSALNNTTNENMISIGKNLTKLKSLSLMGSWNLNEERFTTLAKHLQNDGLEQLDLRTCSGFNNKCLEQLGSKLTNLTALDLTMTGVKGDEAMILIGKYCTKLKSLIIRETAITDEGFIDGISKLTDLTQLDITSCKQLTNKSLEALKACTNLTDLNVSFVENFTHEGIDSLLQVLKLKYLDASQADITDHTLDLLAENCPDLIRLNLQICPRISDDGVENLVKKCQNLVKLDVGFCDQLTDQLMKAVLDYSTSIRNLNMEHCTKLTINSLDGLDAWLERRIEFGIHSKINVTSSTNNMDFDAILQIRKKHEPHFNLIFKKPKAAPTQQ